MRDPNYVRFTCRYYAEDDTELAQNVTRHKQEGWVIRWGKENADGQRTQRLWDYGAQTTSLGRVPGDPRK